MDSSPSDADESRLRTAIEDQAIPLDTVEPVGSGDDTDLDPVADALDDATVVGMGEATHGTWEFDAVRHRLVRKLVEDHGLRAVAVEADFANLLAVNDYVCHGDGTGEEAMGAFRDTAVPSWVFGTRELHRMIEWLRTFNEGRPADDHVGFYGIDVQSPHTASSAIEAYLDTADPVYAETFGQRAASAEGDLEAARQLAADVSQRVQVREDEHVAESSRLAWERARHLTRVLEMSLRYYDVIDDEGMTARAAEIRDEGMAETVDRIRDFAGAERIAVWAHNAHLNRGRNPGLDRPHRTLGHFLAETHGRDYYALGTDFGTGTVTARPPDAEHHADPRTFEVREVPDDSTAEVFVDVSHPAFFLDFEDAKENDEVASWLEQTRGYHSMGEEWMGGEGTSGSEMPLTERVDGLVFVRETTPTSRFHVSEAG